MTFDMHRQEVAIARFAVIAPLVTSKLDPPALTALRRTILAQLHHFPDALEGRRVSARTLSRWLRAYQKALSSGTVAALAALAPQGRSDKGKPRVFDESIVEEAIKLRQELATRSTALLVEHTGSDVKAATLAYHLRKRGATRKAIAATSRAFPLYETEGPNIIWQSDVKDGFWLPDPTDPTRMREVHLMSFLDDHSRLVLHGEFYFKESLPCLFDCFKKAVVKYGVPAKVYWDNGPIYKSRQTALVAARLGTRIIRATPYHPEGHGKVERFWLTVVGSFMEEARHAGLATLAELNEHFWAWLDNYNNRVHSSTGKTPFERWRSIGQGVRKLHPADLAEAFLWADTRRVKKTGTLSLQGNEYKVADSLVGKTVEVRFDPLDLAVVRVYHNGVFVATAAPAVLTTHTHRKATPKTGDEKYLPLPSSKRLLDARTARRRAAVEADLDILAPACGKDEPRVTPAPEVLGGRLTEAGFTKALEAALGRALTDGEQAVVAQFFYEHAPFGDQDVREVLAASIERRGNERHITYYLGEITTFQTGRKS